MRNHFVPFSDIVPTLRACRLKPWLVSFGLLPARTPGPKLLMFAGHCLGYSILVQHYSPSRKISALRIITLLAGRSQLFELRAAAPALSFSYRFGITLHWEESPALRVITLLAGRSLLYELLLFELLSSDQL